MTRILLTGITSAIISLERRSYTVSEDSGFVEVCVILESLGVEEVDITVDIFTESISAIGKPTLRVICKLEKMYNYTVDSTLLGHFGFRLAQ